VSGELSATGAPSSELDGIEQGIVTCSVYNSFDYERAINVTKVNDPTVVRGDLTPPTTVTSTYEVTNPFTRSPTRWTLPASIPTAPDRRHLGRLLRPKQSAHTTSFYTLIARNTVDQDFAQNRQRFLAEQGYA
jgi:hypothetical protein